MKEVEVSELIGKVVTKIVSNKSATVADRLTFFCTDGTEYTMLHEQDCCEGVYIEDINGDLNDLLNSPILLAEEVCNHEDPPLNENEESYTWTFYRFATKSGHVTIRWYGSSNGYYSESVSFFKEEQKQHALIELPSGVSGNVPLTEYTESDLITFGNYLFSDKRLCFVMGKWLATPNVGSFAEFAYKVKEEDINEWKLERQQSKSPSDE